MSTEQEVTLFMRRSAPINLIVHMPQTAEGKAELAKRVASVHASSVTQRLKSLNCPTTQKFALLDAIIDDAKLRSCEQVGPPHGE